MPREREKEYRSVRGKECERATKKPTCAPRRRVKGRAEILFSRVGLQLSCARGY